MGIPMDTKADSGLNHTPAEVSFVRGGPFYRAQQALGLIHANKWNLGRRAAVVIVITWLPLIVLTAQFLRVGSLVTIRKRRVPGLRPSTASIPEAQKPLAHDPHAAANPKP
jgi:hypothetical protein